MTTPFTRPSTALARLGLALLLGALAGCADEEGPLEPTYANVEAIVNRTCSLSSSCHGEQGRGEARLNFDNFLNAGRPVTDAMVGVSACEYDFMPIVDPGNPDNSWLMVKLDGPRNDRGELQFVPDAAWDHGLVLDQDGRLPRSTCPLTGDGEIAFGLLMPRNLTEPLPLRRREIEMIREWIRLGAPGPE